MLDEFDEPAKPSWEERLFRWLKAPLQILLGWLTTSVSDHLIAPSRVTAAELLRDYRAEVVEVVPNAMGHRKVDITAVEGLPNNRHILLFLGRLRIRKGVDILLEAFNLVRHDEGVGGGTLVIAGDGEHRGAVEKRARSLELGSSVVFLGRCNSGQVKYLLDRAKALVVPSLYEGMPLVILEAMDAGVPVVASSVSGIPEIVEDGETGWLVEAGSVDSLVAALTEVLSDVGEAQRRGESGRQRLDSVYRPKHAASQWLKIVQNTPR
jgi:glycosyltransferase involved in cell wall biosynthesis